MVAYSRLKRVLKEHHISISELHRRISANGIQINRKSLYRLNDEDTPLERLDMRVAGAICQFCTVPLSDWIVFQDEVVRLKTLSQDKQSRLDSLMENNNEGILTKIEREELHLLVREAEEITLSNARLLVEQRNRLNTTNPLVESSAV